MPDERIITDLTLDDYKNIKIIDLMDNLLRQVWHNECTLQWVIKGSEKEIRVKHEPSGGFLRHSKGPRTGCMWDVYGDDFLTAELALVELSKAPSPPRNKAELGIIEFNIFLDKKESFLEDKDPDLEKE